MTTKTTSLLGRLAEVKRLPIEFLSRLCRQDRPGRLMIPYRAEDGSPCRPRMRHSVSASNSCWRGHSLPIVPYGLDRLTEARHARHVILVEGESDCWATWLHRRPCLGIPGCSMWGTLKPEHFREIETIYIWQEPGRGGEAFVAGTVRRLSAIGFTGRVLIARIDGVKDLADLHAADPLAFDDRLDQALAAAAPAALQEPTCRQKANCGSASTGHGLDVTGVDLRAVVVADLGQPDQAGRWCCPFHDDHKPSLSLYLSRDGKRRYKCHACGEGGDALDWLQKRRGLSLADAMEALRIERPGHKARSRRDLQRDVRINSGAQGTRNNSDTLDLLARVGSLNCQNPLPAYFRGKGEHAGSRLFGVHRCGGHECDGCHNAWRRDWLLQFVEADEGNEVIDDKLPMLPRHHKRYGGEFYCLEVDAERLATVTRWIGRYKTRDGVYAESVQYAAVQRADDPKRVVLIATAPIPDSEPLTLRQAQDTLGGLILAVTPAMRENRNRPVTNSRGWGRQKRQNLELYARPSTNQLVLLRDEIRRRAKERKVTAVRDFFLDSQFRMTFFEVPDGFDDDELLMPLGIVPLRFQKYTSVGAWGSGSKVTACCSEPPARSHGPPGACSHNQNLF